MFARQGFQESTLKRAISAAIANLPPVHDLPGQEIDGGTTGEHYHLTEDEWIFLTDLAENGIPEPPPVVHKIYEPVAAAGSLLFTTAGDCMMAWGGNYAS